MGGVPAGCGGQGHFPEETGADAADRGLVWAGEFYDNAVSYYNSFNPGFLSEYIVDGVFLSGKARDDLEFITNELFNTENKRKKYFDAYYS